MNIILWILQVALAAKCISVPVTHGLRPDAAKMASGMERLGGWARPVLILTSVGTFLAGVGLVLPGALGGSAQADALRGGGGGVDDARRRRAPCPVSRGRERLRGPGALCAVGVRGLRPLGHRTILSLKA